MSAEEKIETSNQAEKTLEMLYETEIAEFIPSTKLR
jgi:hypothetical protein